MDAAVKEAPAITGVGAAPTPILAYKHPEPRTPDAERALHHPRGMSRAPHRRPAPKLPFEGPRERLAAVGAAGLSDAELLALVLGTGTRGEPVTVLAARALSIVGGPRGLGRQGVGALAQITGIGLGKAARVVASVELGRRAQLRMGRTGQSIRSSRDVYELVRGRVGAAEREHFLAIALDAKNRPVAELVIGLGGLSQCPVEPADVFRALLREAAAGVVFAHNHPSGDPSPSADDLRLTERLAAAGELLGIRVLDHVIVTREGYFSFLDAGLLGVP